MAVDEAGRRIQGVVVTDPDNFDRTSGRLLQRDRVQQIPLPTRLRRTDVTVTTRRSLDRPEEAGMSEPSWRVDELEQEALGVAASNPALVTMHFLLTALRRRWRVWMGLACIGMILGLAGTLMSPPKSVGSATLLLAHETGANPEQAMSTDVSLLRTRTLAVDVIDGGPGHDARRVSAVGGESAGDHRRARSRGDRTERRDRRSAHPGTRRRLPVVPGRSSRGVNRRRSTVATRSASHSCGGRPRT